MWVFIFPISTASKYSLEKRIWKERLSGNCIFLLGGKLLLQKKEWQQTPRGSARCRQCAAAFRGITDTGQLLASKTIHPSSCSRIFPLNSSVQPPAPGPEERRAVLSSHPKPLRVFLHTELKAQTHFVYGYKWRPKLILKLSVLQIFISFKTKGGAWMCYPFWNSAYFAIVHTVDSNVSASVSLN